MKSIRLFALAALLPACAAAQFQDTTPLPRPLLSHAAVMAGGRLYISGGVSDSGPAYLSDFYYCADMAPDGRLGEWRPGARMPEMMGLGLNAMVENNGFLYIIGGANMTGSRNAVYYGALQADGSIAAWLTARSMTYRLHGHSASVYNGRLYVIGGIRNTGSTAGIVSAPINADGSLGMWRNENPLPLPVYGHKSFVKDGRLFVLGGASGAAPYVPGGLPPQSVSDAVYAAPFNADGTLGAWAAQPPLPAKMSLFGLAVSEKSAYLLGGYDGGVRNAVYFSPFTPEGGLGAWQALYALPQNLVSLAAAAGGEYLYAIGGGQSYLGSPVANIYFASLKTDIKAFVRMTPTALNAKSNGKWVSVIVGLPEEDAANVDPLSLKIAAVNGVAVNIAQDPKWAAKLVTGDSEDFAGLAGVKYLSTKFPRADVAKLVPDGEFTIKVQGSLKNGRRFTGESMNKGLSSVKKFASEASSADFSGEGAGGAKVFIPAGAFKGNPHLAVSAGPEEEAAEEVKAQRAVSRDARGLAEVSAPYEFGPGGLAFEKPVKISIPYDPAAVPPGIAEDALKVAWWNAEKSAWEPQASSVDAEKKLVTAEVAHFSVYQVMAQVREPAPAVSVLAAPAAPAGAITEAYVFPNPAKGGAVPVLHLAVASGSRAAVKVYSSSGRLACEASLAGAPAGGAYELPLRGEFTSGVYYYSAEVVGGSGTLRKAGKFAVVR